MGRENRETKTYVYIQTQPKMDMIKKPAWLKEWFVWTERDKCETGGQCHQHLAE